MSTRAKADGAGLKPSFRRAIALNPNSPETRLNFVTILLWLLSRIGETVQQFRAAEKADPLSPELQFEYGGLLISAAATRKRLAIASRAHLRFTDTGRLTWHFLAGRKRGHFYFAGEGDISILP